MWHSENVPDNWHNSTLVQLFKGKGDRTVLDNFRHIHIKEEIPKLFGHLVMSASRDTLFKNMSKFQIGATGHRPQEHLFVLKSVVDLCMQNDQTIFLSLFDISKFFDRENLRDCLNAVYKSGINGKLYRLLYEMNRNSRISVQTPVGLSEKCDTGETVGQGTLEGAVISAVSLDKGIEEFFEGSEYEVVYAGLRLQPLLFQDDVSRLAYTPNDLQAGNDMLECMAESKLLDFNLTKSGYMQIGKKRSDSSYQEQLNSHPITLCGKPMPYVKEAKLLGDWLSDQGLSHSIAVTVRKRKGLAIASIYEIRTVVEDCRSNVVGGMSVGIDLWESTVLPMLLFNSETWMSMSQSTLNELEDIQKRFLRCLLAVGPGCPIPSLYWETGVTVIKYRILQKKLLFIHHLYTLPSSSLAKEVLNLQESLNLPGLIKECNQVLKDNNLFQIDKYTKAQWKLSVKGLIMKLNEDELIAMSKKYKKIDFDTSSESKLRHSFLKDLKVHDARMLFRIRSKMVQTIQMNFPSDKTFTANLWTCVACKAERDTQSHVMRCEKYSMYREGLDLANDLDCVKYFQKIVRIRSM